MTSKVTHAKICDAIKFPSTSRFIFDSVISFYIILYLLCLFLDIQILVIAWHLINLFLFRYAQARQEKEEH